MSGPGAQAREARRYQRARLLADLAEAALLLAFLLVVLLSGASLALRELLGTLTASPALVVLALALVLGGLWKLVSLPLSFWSGFLLERRHGLSTESPGGWLRREAKGTLVGAALFLPLLLLSHLSLRLDPGRWWLWTGAAFFLFSVALAALAPVVILPLFHRFEPVADPRLAERLKAAAARAGVNVEGVYRFDLSRETRKANAALAGLGRTRRVLIADTLLESLAPEEIEAVFSHELGHHRLRHLPRGLVAGALAIFAGLGLAHLALGWAAALLRLADPRYGSLDDPAMLPLFALLLSLWGMFVMPLQNALSRRFEREADAWALSHGPGAAPFTSALEKIAARNLADPEPHPLVEAVFHSHPSIRRRLEAAREAGLRPPAGP